MGSMNTADRPLPPPPSGASACSFGDRNGAVGWRWFRVARTWKAVCHRHTGGPHCLAAGDFVPDTTETERQDA
ncbi:hypothetical protein GCM10023259_080190 [Thermocatellispora tengchongensis]